MHQFPCDLAANALQLSSREAQYTHPSLAKFTLFQPAREGVNAIRSHKTHLCACMRCCWDKHLQSKPGLYLCAADWAFSIFTVSVNQLLNTVPIAHFPTLASHHYIDLHFPQQQYSDPKPSSIGIRMSTTACTRHATAAVNSFCLNCATLNAVTWHQLVSWLRFCLYWILGIQMLPCDR